LSEPRKFDTAGIFQRHTGIDRSTGTVARQIFYTSQAMAPIHPEPESDELKDQFLSGGLFLDDRQLEALRETIDEGTIFAGADRSRGFGELELALDEAEPPSFDLDSWNDRFQEKLDKIEVGDRPSGSTSASSWNRMPSWWTSFCARLSRYQTLSALFPASKSLREWRRLRPFGAGRRAGGYQSPMTPQSPWGASTSSAIAETTGKD